MTVETINNGIEDLDDTLPAGTDPKSEGDNHMRNIKLALGLSFPGSDGAWNTNQIIRGLGYDAKAAPIIDVGAPVNPTDAARKGDVDAVSAIVIDNTERIDDIEEQVGRFQSFGHYDGINDVLEGGSGDFSINKVATGEYEITFSEAATSQYSQALVVQVQGFPPFAGGRATNSFPFSTTLVGVYGFNADSPGLGDPIDIIFSFIRTAV